MEDEALDTAPVETPTGNEITQPETTEEITQPEATPDYESLFAEPKADEAVPVDPAAPVTPEIPKEIQDAFGMSQYVKDQTQLAGAVHLADQVLKVQNGEAPIAGLLENFRSQNEPAYVKAITESLIPYLEQITGKKLMDPSAAPGEQKTPEQQRIDAIEQQFQKQEQERQNFAIRQQVQQANGVLIQKAGEALKGTFLEGKEKEYLAQLAPHMGMNEEQATKVLLAGDPQGAVAKAVKALVAQQESVGRAYAQFKIKESKTLKAGLPAGKGNPRPVIAGELPADATKAEMVQYLSAQ